MIHWLPWGADAFARASREGKPVLLSITAAWCRACHEMDRTTYADPDVAGLIRDRFVAVRVDTDRRPDINERYNLGGWPTTAFLTADGARDHRRHVRAARSHARRARHVSRRPRVNAPRRTGPRNTRTTRKAPIAAAGWTRSFSTTRS